VQTWRPQLPSRLLALFGRRFRATRTENLISQFCHHFIVTNMNGQSVLGRAMAVLMADEGFVQATLQAARTTEETGRECDYRIMETPSGNQRITPPNTGSEERIFATGLLESVCDGNTLIYHGHTHPHEVAQHSNDDLDFVDIYSDGGTPVFAVCVNEGSGENVELVALRRKRPATTIESVAARLRNYANTFLREILNLDTQGFTSVRYRTFNSACEHGLKEAREGRKNYDDIVPDALGSTGLYEAGTFKLTKKYAKHGA
jgi:hypothetical protein